MISTRHLKVGLVAGCLVLAVEISGPSLHGGDDFWGEAPRSPKKALAEMRCEGAGARAGSDEVWGTLNAGTLDCIGGPTAPCTANQ